MAPKRTAGRKGRGQEDGGPEGPAGKKSAAGKKKAVTATTAKKPAAKRPGAKEAAVTSTVVRKATAAKKPVAKKAAEGTVAEGASSKKSAAKKAPGKKAAAKKAVAKKTAAAKATAPKSAAGRGGTTKSIPTKSAAKKSTAKKAGAGKVAKQTGATTVVAKKTPGTATAATNPTAVPKARFAAVEPGELAVRPGEDPWTPEEVAEARAELESEAMRLRGEIDASEQALVGLMRDSGDGAGDDQADTGTKNITREHEMALSANAREMLEQTERALDGLDAGTYGLCESCGDPIGKARMQAFPRATLCVECKQKQERR
ncbi:TraR/DksA family transcriptional regulator [Streptomyces chiangmaiensis]|uniref:TraR/DksA family transcriptional regulator n=1 Tax=Streptomyces chiangmaiensis TaxID=766497 RepID=A0ABU7F8S9_9ACTN|nr:TraR/DksA family transcriptional regulator [Streptomyces chiangmaiensis]MED7820475.1 TraR/DksA family transcriptional regulator [Streptomyces chiangmaiensis]